MSASRNLLMVVAAALVFALAAAWPYAEDDYSSWRKARRSFQCTGSGGKCFSTSHCCHGFVCAAVNDYLVAETRTKKGEDPEIPGFCVKEKDLQPCDMSMECLPTSKCVTLGRSGERYCVPRPKERPSVLQQLSSARGNKGYQGAKASGGQSAPCAGSNDCKAFSEDGDPLCCQRVKRGRTGVKVMCDVKTSISHCLE